MPIRRLHENHWVKLVVFGSTGGTGRELVRQALELGHEVTAFARDAQALGIAHERLRIVEADALWRVSVDAAIEGQSAVLSALGTRSLFHAHQAILSERRVHRGLHGAPGRPAADRGEFAWRG